ncbi:MAG: hypothetical protein Q7V16_00580 [Hydrogenophaga sp.]|jgi:hypothetical protein|nr:hypothetical protein [Hydrogenophaga sp.]MDP1783458.1 hypothetical protein [Hydrogenophaga sp.]
MHRNVTSSAFLVLVMASLAATAASLDVGASFSSATYLIGVSQDNRLSRQVKGLQNGGFETSGGQWVGFERWYAPRWRDTKLTWMTQVNRNVGLTWGFSTGENAPKYSIQPGLQLGFIFQSQPHKNGYVAITGSTVVGGRLREKTCTANYGDIGGVQRVNCRLAASTLAPDTTLNYLINDKPESTLKVTYRYFFN